MLQFNEAVLNEAVFNKLKSLMGQPHFKENLQQNAIVRGPVQLFQGNMLSFKEGLYLNLQGSISCVSCTVPREPMGIN